MEESLKPMDFAFKLSNTIISRFKWYKLNLFHALHLFLQRKKI
jgi:hypothetical protein